MQVEMEQIPFSFDHNRRDLGKICYFEREWELLHPVIEVILFKG
jgi:hypothetical protein